MSTSPAYMPPDHTQATYILCACIAKATPPKLFCTPSVALSRDFSKGVKLHKQYTGHVYSHFAGGFSIQLPITTEKISSF